eukprot:6178363-Pleurochrysis_carterae.AAC.1
MALSLPSYCARGARVARDCFVVPMKSALPISQCVTPRPREDPVASRYKTGWAGRAALKLLRKAPLKLEYKSFTSATDSRWQWPPGPTTMLASLAML